MRSEETTVAVGGRRVMVNADSGSVEWETDAVWRQTAFARYEPLRNAFLHTEYFTFL